MVIVDVTAAVPEMVGGALAEHVGIFAAPATPLTAHVSATEPVKPPLGVIVRVEVVEPPWATAAAVVALNENAPPAPPPPLWMTYAAFSIMLVPSVGLIAIASIVSDALTEMGAEYCVDPAEGVLPLVV